MRALLPFLHAAAGAAAIALATCTSAQTAWPAQNIRVIVPFTPGTGADILARTLGPRLSERLGRAIVVENIAGASGSIGAQAAAVAAADGYTLLLTASTLVTNAQLHKNAGYDAEKSFAPVALLATTSLALGVTANFPGKSLDELVRLAKASPGKFTYASPGNGTPQHLAMELFKSGTGTDILHVPYKGSAGAVTDLLGGQVDMMIYPLHFALEHARAGRVRQLGVPRETRHPKAPEVATFREQGVRGADVDAWYGLFAPAGAPQAVVEKLNTEVTQALAVPAVLAVFDNQGLAAAPGTARQLATLVQEDGARWGALIRKMRIAAD
jgi:tripartite-type tricarboxylate transporter receptor subunit TctC